jgi:hypothetical protein
MLILRPLPLLVLGNRNVSSPFRNSALAEGDGVTGSFPRVWRPV